MERDYSGFATGTNYQDFNSHAHVERDQRSNGKTYAVCISTHTLTWSVTFNKGELKDIKTFQLTRSRGAWLSKRNKNHTVNEFQLTRSRGAWRLEKSTPCNHLQISTHTLTWSVTPVFNYSIENIHISTHTLTWSVTRCILPYVIPPKISTHTLTWSVTFGILRQQGSNWKFQLTRSRGAWLAGVKLINALYDFNSHAHVERDDSERQYIVNMLHFNSHAHVERDWNTQTAGVKLEISTHTLTWSVTWSIRE